MRPPDARARLASPRVSLGMHGRRRLVAGGRPPGRLEADPAQEREQDQAAAEQHEDQPEVVGIGQELGLPGHLLVELAERLLLRREGIGAVCGEVGDPGAQRSVVSASQTLTLPTSVAWCDWA